MNLTEDIILQIQRDFGPQSEAAIDYLKGQPDIAPESLRVLRCIVFLAEGNIDLLLNLVGSAKSDYRDVIFWAEYVNHEMKNPDRIRNFNKPFGQHDIQTKAQPKQTHRLPSDVKSFFVHKK